MPEHTLNEDAADLMNVEGSNIVLPEYQCNECGKAISEEFSEATGECAGCHNGRNQTEGLERIRTVSIYLPDEERGGQGIVEEISEFSNQIYEAKSGEHTSKISNVLKYGARNNRTFSSADLITFPPSGEGGFNHMDAISQPLEDVTGTPVEDVVRKTEDYPSQKSTGPVEERLENLEGKLGLVEPESQSTELSEISTAIVVDDVVVTGSTLSNTARTLKDAGVDEVYGLAITRNESLNHLSEHADLLQEEG